jgi:CO/xanthine dehydrogenase Mo-binding subunit
MTTIPETKGIGEFNVVGTRPIRHDGLDKVTGRARFAADIHLPGMLYGRILRSPHAHARIRSIDTSKAESLPGVKAIATARDFPIIENRVLDLSETMQNVRMLAENVLAHGKVLYKGHAVAAVAATDPYVAEEALNRIEVDYEVLPSALTLQEAMKPDAPLLYDEMTTRFRMERFGSGEDTGVKSNIAAHVQFKRGDLEQGYKEADVVVEREFTTETVHQGYIEPHASTGHWAADGHLTIWTSTQTIFGIRATTAAILDIPESLVKVIPMEIGGGFGAKLTTYLDPVVAILSRKSGRPVKIVMSRKEVFEGSGPASATHLRCKIGANTEGRITAAQLYLAYEAGAFPGSAVGSGALSGFGPYKLDNMQVDGYDVVCNKQRVQAYRAPGMPQACFAVESVVDELAEELGTDPLEFRLKNAVQEGDRMPSGVVHPRIGCKELEEAMKAHPHYTAPLEGANRGRGVAVGFRLNGGGTSSVSMNVNGDGTVSLVSGAVDIGGSRAAAAMAAAEALGLRAEDVIPTVVDTDSVGWTGVTGGSRVTFDTTWAATLAAEEVARQMQERAAFLWEVQAEDVEFSAGVFTCTKDPAKKMTFKELAANLMNTGGPITYSTINRETGVGPTFGGMIVDVEVDPETGKVQVLRCTGFMDVGRAIHPSYAEGQLQGGIVQGIGWALWEEYFYSKDGTMLNSSLLDYRMPTCWDVPMIDTVMVEVPHHRHPLGVRGVGEIPIVMPAAAVANAVSQAIGVRMTGLPMNPGAVLQALEEK